MKRTTSIFAFMIFSLVVFLSFSLNVKTAFAQDAGYSIQHVDHQVEVLYSGHVVIRDTITVTGQVTDGFLIGFPYKYGSYVLKGMAYDANTVFPMSLGVQLGDRSGFYGAEIRFPQGSPQVFTAMFILANDLVSPRTNGFILDFPAYPSFVKDAAECNVTLVLPQVAVILNITKNDGVVYTENFVKENLNAFTYSPAIAIFNLPDVWIRLVDVKELNRQITISPVGDIVASDSYRIVNNSTGSIGYLEISLPLNASNIVGRNEFGRTLTVEVLPNTSNTPIVLTNVTFTAPLNSGESALLTVEYTLPSVSSEQTTRFALNLDLFPYFNYYVDEASVTIVPPEGARFLMPQLSSISPSLSLSRELFQETLSINAEGVSYIDLVIPSENTVQITYDYNSLWLSFRPTLWAWALAVVGSVVVAVWRRPKAPAPLRIVVPKLPIGLSPDHVRAFTEAYEEKNRITSELKFLDIRAQKGKIPRRRYKVQRRTLEVRFDALSRNITEMKEVFRSAGGSYADLIRQLDIAETELDEVETNIRSVEARHRRGELSLETYKKFLSDYQQRKEKAETTVNGILLRLREEIR